MSDSCVVIELVGAPAIGKSTTVKALMQMAPAGDGWLFGTEDLRQLLYGRRSSGGMRKLAAVLTALLRHPLLFTRLLRFGIRASRLSHALFTQLFRCMRLLTEIEKLAAMPRQGQPRVLLLDQGLLQYLGSIAVPGRGTLPDHTGLALALARGRLSGAVWVEGDEILALARLEQRHQGESRFDGAVFDIADYRRFVAVIGRSFREVQAVLPGLELDARQPAQSNGGALKAWLDGLRDDR